MTYAAEGRRALEYYPCRYGKSRAVFRGPRKPLDGDYVAFLGGTETYGRFVEVPFPELVEKALGKSCVNFGAINAGTDLYLKDPAILGLVSGARVAVLEMMGAQNMSNRYYAVHPRRNDRFVKASDQLQRLYPEVDFTEFHFTGHMLSRLSELSAERFANIVEELRLSWVARKKHLLTVLPVPVVTIWFADHMPCADAGITTGPLFVSAEMVEAVKPRVAAHVDLVPSPEAQKAKGEGMVYSEFEASAATEMLGGPAHREAAKALAKVLKGMVT